MHGRTEPPCMETVSLRPNDAEILCQRHIITRRFDSPSAIPLAVPDKLHRATSSPFGNLTLCSSACRSPGGYGCPSRSDKVQNAQPRRHDFQLCCCSKRCWVFRFGAVRDSLPVKPTYQSYLSLRVLKNWLYPNKDNPLETLASSGKGSATCERAVWVSLW